MVDCDELFFDAVDLYERLFRVVGGLAFEVEDGVLFLVVAAVFFLRALVVGAVDFNTLLALVVGGDGGGGDTIAAILTSCIGCCTAIISTSCCSCCGKGFRICR